VNESRNLTWGNPACEFGKLENILPEVIDQMVASTPPEKLIAQLIGVAKEVGGRYGKSLDGYKLIQLLLLGDVYDILVPTLINLLCVRGGFSA
jgi:hypothetical protein